MPALRPCLVCGALSRATRCPRPAIQRGSSGRQRSFRREALRQTGGRCAICGSAEGVQAHHLRTLTMGGTDADGGAPLCPRCHLRAHGRGTERG